MNEKKISKAMSALYIAVAAGVIIAAMLFNSNVSKDAVLITVDGFMGPLTVQVTVAEGIITEAKVTKSTEGEFLPQSAETIFEKAIENGNPNGIDIVAGATATSKALIAALQQAYIDAKTDESSIIGYGEGYKGPLSVVITKDNGKITSAELLTLSDSEFSVPTALAVLEQAVTTGSVDNLDVIAGATSTSNGTIAALKDAMSK